ncbi:MAG: histidinol-phosphate transaminase [Gammaproteobacteria bacterium]
MACDLLSLATPGVAGLQPYHPGKPIQELEREFGISGIIKLASNENPLGPSPKVTASLPSIPDLARYPDGNGHDLKNVLAEKHQVDPVRITLGNGSNDILEMAARAFVTDEHQIIFSEHAFAVYPLVTEAIGAGAVVTPAREWGHDLQAMQAAITDRTRLIFVANPNNPTGTWLDSRSLQHFVAAVPGTVILVIDEAYFDYAQGKDYPDCIPWIEKYPNLVVTRTFSKAYGLAGLRIGYGISHPDVADLMNRVRQPFNVNSVALYAAEIALRDEEHIAKSVSVNRTGMQQLIDGFNAMGIHFIPSRGNFICIDLARPVTGIYQQLLRAGIIVRPIESYGMPNHLRITVGLKEENERFLDALAKILAA